MKRCACRGALAAGLPPAGRRDWGAILCELAAAGVPHKAVAGACSRNPAAVKAWARGGEPKESDARIVLALYAKHCPQQYAEHCRAFAFPIGGPTIDAG